jgi:transcriptional regulator with XRE-family HTH domain
MRQLRKERGITQEGLAKGVECHWRTISDIERGESVPRADLLARIARFLGVTMEELIGAGIEGSRHGPRMGGRKR